MTNSPLPSIYNYLVDGNLKSFAGHAAHSIQVADSMATFYQISAVNAAVNGKFVVKAGGRNEPVTLFIVLIGDPGERKSSMASISKRPLQDWLFSKNNKIKMKRRKVERKNRKIKKQIQTLEKKAENLDPLVAQFYDEEIGLLESQIQTLKEHRIFFNDTTIPALQRVLADYDGKISYFEPESHLISLLCKKGFNIKTFCNAYDSEELYIHRVKEDQLHIPRPSITISITAQPEFALNLLRNENCNASGFLGRCFYLWFSKLAGNRKTQTPPIPEEGLQWWHNKITSLLNIPDQVDEHGQTQPWVLELDHGAMACFNQYDEYAERAILNEGFLSYIQGYGSKQSGKVLRLAALFHCIKHDAPQSHLIDEESLRQAISVGEELKNHAQHACYYAIHGAKIEAAQSIVDWLNNHFYQFGEHKVFNVKDAYANTESLTHKAIQNGINFLFQQGVITEYLGSYASEAAKRTVGRKKGPYYVIRQVLNPIPMAGNMIPFN